MKRLAAAAVALLLLGAAPDPTALLSQRQPLTVDYYSLRSGLDPDGLQALMRGVSAEYMRRAQGGPCFDGSEIRAYAGLMLGAQAKSSAEFAAQRAAGEILVADVERRWPRLQAGERLPGYENVSGALKLSEAATDPRLKDLFLRQARDQFVRTDTPETRIDPRNPFQDPARFYANQVLSVQMCAVDEANTAWLRDQLKAHGWFGLSRYGRDADMAAFLMVQHADRNRAFQRETLGLLEKLVAQGESEPRTYAYLYDRLAGADRRPQRYGTQGRCTGPGVWEPHPVEDPAHLDERRAQVGLAPEAEYQARFKTLCP